MVGTAPAESGKGTIVVFHGNAGTAADRAYYVSALAHLGYRVILAEYPGYGGRKGKLGESLGCGVAASAVRQSPVTIDGIILITPWDTLLSVAEDHFPRLPVQLLLRDKYDTTENLKAYRGRVAVIGAERDETIPISHAKALFASLPGEKKMWTVRGASHNDWPHKVNPAWWRELTAYMEGNNT